MTRPHPAPPLPEPAPRLPEPAPPLPSHLVAAPARTAALRAAGVDSHELAGPLWIPVLRGVHGFLGTDPTDR